MITLKCTFWGSYSASNFQRNHLSIGNSAKNSFPGSIGILGKILQIFFCQSSCLEIAFKWDCLGSPVPETQKWCLEQSKFDAQGKSLLLQKIEWTYYNIYLQAKRETRQVDDRCVLFSFAGQELFRKSFIELLL